MFCKIYVKTIAFIINMLYSYIIRECDNSDLSFN